MSIHESKSITASNDYEFTISEANGNWQDNMGNYGKSRILFYIENEKDCKAYIKGLGQLDDQVLIKKITWGINFPWLKDKIHINARLESINTGSFYSNYKRCIFITDGYFEWKKNKDYKTPYFHYLKESFIYLAGLYNDNGAILITFQSSSKLNDIHHRQPLIIKDNHLTTWIQKRKIVPINS